MTHRIRRHIRALVALLGVTALIVALVVAVTKASAESPPPLSPNSDEVDGTAETTLVVIESEVYPPPLTNDVQVSYPDIPDQQMLEERWNARDRTAGFQPDYFVWYSWSSTSRGVVDYWERDCFDEPIALRYADKSNKWVRNLISGAHLPDALRIAESLAEGRMLYTAEHIAQVCGPYWVAGWRHQLTVSVVPWDQVYYGDTLMWHPETGEVVGFLDWLWETTDSYEQMMLRLSQVGTSLVNEFGDPDVAEIADQIAYNLAVRLLRN